MATTARHAATDKDSPSGPAKHIHHGRTAAAWVGSMVAMVAFLIGGIAVVMQFWPLFWGAVILLVVGLVVTRVLQVTGHGAT